MGREGDRREEEEGGREIGEEEGIGGRRGEREEEKEGGGGIGGIALRNI